MTNRNKVNEVSWDFEFCSAVSFAEKLGRHKTANWYDANYIGYINRYPHIEEHKYYVIGNYLKDEYNQRPNNLQEKFAILK